MSAAIEDLASEVVTALAIPGEARVDQRVPKKLLLEHGAPTAADRRRINERIEEVWWLAALKPSSIGVSAYQSDTQEYLEIAVLSLVARDGDADVRLMELVHRAIPYPVVLLSQGAECLSLTLAHKRQSLGDSAKVVLEGALCEAQLRLPLGRSEREFVGSLAVTLQRPSHLRDLYDGWIARMEALQAARVTGGYAIATTEARVSARREVLARYGALLREIAMLRAEAERERQVNKRVELNLAIRRLEDERELAIKQL